MNFQLWIKELFGAFHVPSINLPVYSRRDWVSWIQWRITIDFLTFSLYLWVLYCPSYFLLNNYTSSDLACTIILMILSLSDMFLAYYSIQTQYLNIVNIIIDPILTLLHFFRKMYSWRYQIFISTSCITVIKVIQFVVTFLIILIMVVFKVDDAVLQ